MGTLLGTYILFSFANIVLKQILGIGTIVYTLSMLVVKNSDCQEQLHSIWGVLASTVGGVFGGLFGTSGPPYVIYLTYKLR